MRISDWSSDVCSSDRATYAQAFDVQEPDYSLIASDPELFAQQMAYYKQATAQRDDLAQRSAYARQQAEQAEAQHREQAMRAEVAILTQEIPEWSDPAKRQEIGRASCRERVSQYV